MRLSLALLAVGAGIMLHTASAQQQDSDAATWQVDVRVSAAAQALVPPVPSQRRSIDTRSRLTPALQEKLSQHAGGMEAEPLPVHIRIAGTGKSLETRIRNLGGTVEATSPGSIYASMTSATIARIARVAEVRMIEPQARFDAQAASIATAAANAGGRGSDALLSLHRQGMRGQGVRVGILDFSFAGYAALVAANQLPAPVAQRSFAPQGDVFADANGSGKNGHGTECARIIHAVAPDADLVIASVGEGRNTTEGRMLAAARWLREQGASVINFSGSGYVSPLDGSGALDRLLDELSTQGSAWIVAAGNQAQLHWQGAIADDNRNGWVDAGTRDATRQFGDLFAIEVQRAGPVAVTLNWNAWQEKRGGRASDLDLFVYRVVDGKAVLVAQSDMPQARAGDRPLETVQSRLEPGIYLIGIRATRIGAQTTAHLFVNGATRMTPTVATGSVGSPGTARRAITVGAGTAGELDAERYSGRGPTDDGRLKPELLAIGEASASEGRHQNDNAITGEGAGFRGTSAAAPLVSGLAALLAGADRPGRDSLRERLQAVARQSSAKTNAAQAGAAWGFINAEKVLAWSAGRPAH